jgi:DNA-binding response OmpR family regulator
MGMHIAAKPDRAECNGHKAFVLVIDDDAANAADMTRILGMGGYECHCCRDLDSAFSQFRATPPDLVIADLSIVGPKGWRLTELLRREIGYVEVPLMFLSRRQVPDIIHRQGEYGGAYYLRKPFDLVVLLELVDKALWSPVTATR